jgi:Ca2+-binding EF-hand superfamily protein
MTDFWQAKMRTYYARIDIDKDGSITRKDFVELAKRFEDGGDLNAEEKTRLEKNILDIWDLNLQPIAHVDVISQEKFLSCMLALCTDPEMRDALAGPLPYFFEAIDANHDNYISKPEYARFYKILGISGNAADLSFDAIDTDKDGRLSKEEFVNAGLQFFYNEDQTAATKNFWGPLLE